MKQERNIATWMLWVNVEKVAKKAKRQLCCDTDV